MDPIAHSLAGATLAQTGLKRLTPLATATLVIGANLPDIDAAVTVLGSDTSLLLRRGLTHGVLALVVLPVLLTLAMMGYDRFWRRRRSPDKEAVKLKGLLILSYIGVLSHPFLDWLNTYGVRLLMPFDGRWFYGDTLFIIDAWMWLLMGATVVFAHSRTKLSKGAWIALGVVMSALVTLVPEVPVPAKVVWWLGVAVIVGLRLRGVTAEQNRRYAVVCVTAFCLYLATMMAGNSMARQGVVDWLGEEDAVITDLMTGPMPANPFARQVLAVSETHYHAVEVRFFNEERYRYAYDPVAIQEPDDIISRALEDPSIRGFVNWMRFPYYEVQELDAGHRVIIRDLRYVHPDDEWAGIGLVSVDVE